MRLLYILDTLDIISFLLYAHIFFDLEYSLCSLSKKKKAILFVCFFFRKLCMFYCVGILVMVLCLESQDINYL